jgi:hypothetical protein
MFDSATNPFLATLGTAAAGGLVTFLKLLANRRRQAAALRQPQPQLLIAPGEPVFDEQSLGQDVVVTAEVHEENGQLVHRIIILNPGPAPLRNVTVVLKDRRETQIAPQIDWTDFEAGDRRSIDRGLDNSTVEICMTWLEGVFPVNRSIPVTWTVRTDVA